MLIVTKYQHRKGRYNFSVYKTRSNFGFPWLKFNGINSCLKHKKKIKRITKTKPHNIYENVQRMIWILTTLSLNK